MQLNEKFRKKLNSLSGNSRIVLKNSVAAILIKGAGVIISVLSMPAFCGILTTKRFSAYGIRSSAL